MSLNRIALRWATVSALSNFSTTPYPTLAGPNIFDSQIVPISNMSEDAIYPLCIVYTDYDLNTLPYKFMAHSDRKMTLTFELLCTMLDQEGSDDEVYQLQYPQTDSDLEFNLDLFEKQIFDALHVDNPAGDAWRGMVANAENYISRRGASVEGGKKLAVRQITIECSVPRDPLVPGVPDYLSEFLTTLETEGEYQDRVQILKAGYEQFAGQTDAEAAIRQMGLTNATADTLAYERGPATVFTPPIQWQNGNGSGSLL
jgi:hypothetical protein